MMNRLLLMLSLLAAVACAPVQPELSAVVPDEGGQTITVVDDIGFTVTQEPYNRIIVASDQAATNAQAGAAAKTALPAFCPRGQVLVLDSGNAMRDGAGRTLWSFKGDCK